MFHSSVKWQFPTRKSVRECFISVYCINASSAEVVWLLWWLMSVSLPSSYLYHFHSAGTFLSVWCWRHHLEHDVIHRWAQWCSLTSTWLWIQFVLLSLTHTHTLTHTHITCSDGFSNSSPPVLRKCPWAWHRITNCSRCIGGSKWTSQVKKIKNKKQNTGSE